MWIDFNNSFTFGFETFKIHKVVRQQNSGVVEDFILPYSLFRSLFTSPKVKKIIKIGPNVPKLS